MTTSVFCSVDDRAHASRVLRELERAGFADSAVSDVEMDGHETPIVAHDHSQTMMRSAALCAFVCAVIGGAVGWLASLAARADSAPFLTAGPFIAIATGAAVGAAAGSLTGSLIGLGMRQSRSEKNRLLLPRQKVRVYVRSLDTQEAPAVERILEAAGAEEISVRAEELAARAANTGQVTWARADAAGVIEEEQAGRTPRVARERTTDSFGGP